MATTTAAAVSKPSFWADYAEATAPTLPETAQGRLMAQLFITKMYHETEWYVRKLRKHGIPVSLNTSDWQYALENPFKCNKCSKLWWDFYCCSADQYKWLRDTDHIDGEDYLRIVAYCPPLVLTPEPEEWRDPEPKQAKAARPTTNETASKQAPTAARQE